MVNAFSGLTNYSDAQPDPSQTTLYFWWGKESLNIVNHEKSLESIRSALKEIESKVDEEKSTLVFNKAIVGIKDDMANIYASLQKAHSVITHERIPASLERFDKRFHYFNKSQSWRWFWIELMLPVFVGIVAIADLWLKIWG